MTEDELRRVQRELFARLYQTESYQPRTHAEYTAVVAELCRRREQQPTED